MNTARACLEDTLRLLLEEAKRARDCSSKKEAFEAGRAEALAESLHTWANQLRTFGMERELGPIWGELSEYLAECGF